MILWLQVTNDEYELPLAVADSCKELARMVGVTPQNIYEAKCKYKNHKKHRRKYRYITVEIEED